MYALGEEKEPRFGFLIPYGNYVKEKIKRYKKDIRHASNWTYKALDDRFICPNGRVVRFKKYQMKKSRTGLKQSFKIYECEDCSDCPLKPACTKAKGNSQIHWNTIWEELKVKAKTALEDDEKSVIYARRKVEVDSVFGHIKGNRSFPAGIGKDSHRVRDCGIGPQSTQDGKHPPRCFPTKAVPRKKVEAKTCFHLNLF